MDYMSEDYYNDGFNAGRGQRWRNNGHNLPQTDGDRDSYEQGQKKGERWKEYDREREQERNR